MFAKREVVTGVVFYCKDCERIVTARQVGRRFVYSCDICRTKNVAFGTEKSIRSYFHFDELPPAVVSGVPVSPSGPATPPVAPVPPASPEASS